MQELTGHIGFYMKKMDCHWRNDVDLPLVDPGQCDNDIDNDDCDNDDCDNDNCDELRAA